MNRFIKRIMPNIKLDGSFDVVFGIEHVMGFFIKGEEDLDISDYSIKSTLVDLSPLYNKCHFFFYPYFDKLIFEILSWGWSVNFYNFHKPEFDKLLIEKYFTKILEKHVSNPQKIFKSLVKTRRVEILSGDRMKSTFETHSHQSGFEIENLVKMDASVVNYSPENAIIVEQNRALILGSNYPFIAMDKDASIYFEMNMESILVLLEKGVKSNFPSPIDFGHNAADNAFYVMGIVSMAKNLLKKSKAHSLKQALDILLHDESYYKRKYHHPLETPWYLSPLKHKNPKSDEFIETGKKILKKWDKR